MSAIFTTFIPIAIFLILPVIIIFARSKTKAISVKITHWLLLVYGGVLLIAMAMSSFIKAEEPTIYQKKPIDFYETANKGRMSEIGKEYVLAENSYEFKGESLSIKSSVPETIFVERKKEGDDRLEVYFYGNGLNVSGLDFTERVIPPSTRLNGEILTVTYPGFQEMKIAFVKNDFMINQFKNQKSLHQMVDYDSTIIYMKIPQNLKISPNPDIYIEYIN